MKPDWATRLQRTFARKYDAGFAKGLMFGKAVGARDERERIVELVEAQREVHRAMGMEASVDYLTHLGALIKGENK